MALVSLRARIPPTRRGRCISLRDWPSPPTSGTLEVMTSDPERAAIDHVAQRLSRQFTNLDTTLVARVVWDTYPAFRHPPHPGRRTRPGPGRRPRPAAGDARRDPHPTTPGATTRPL